MPNFENKSLSGSVYKNLLQSINVYVTSGCGICMLDPLALSINFRFCNR